MSVCVSEWVSEWMNKRQLFIDNLLTNSWLAITFGLFADHGYPIGNSFFVQLVTILELLLSERKF